MTAMTTTSERRETGLSRELLVLGAVVVLGTIMSILDVTIVNVAIPTLGSDFHTSISTIQWVMTGYLLSFASVIPLTGWATERFGAKRVWLVSLLLFMLGSVLSGFAWSIGSLVGFRAVQGLGGGMIVPVGQTILAQAAGPKRIGRVMSVIGVPLLLGPVFGPVIGGALVGQVSWRWIFFINLPVGVAAGHRGVPLRDGRGRQPGRIQRASDDRRGPARPRAGRGVHLARPGPRQAGADRRRAVRPAWLRVRSGHQLPARRRPVRLADPVAALLPDRPPGDPARHRAPAGPPGPRCRDRDADRRLAHRQARRPPGGRGRHDPGDARHRRLHAGRRAHVLRVPRRGVAGDRVRAWQHEHAVDGGRPPSGPARCHPAGDERAPHRPADRRRDRDGGPGDHPAAHDQRRPALAARRCRGHGRALPGGARPGGSDAGRRVRLHLLGRRRADRAGPAGRAAPATPAARRLTRERRVLREAGRRAVCRWPASPDPHSLQLEPAQKLRSRCAGCGTRDAVVPLTIPVMAG